MAKFEIMYRLSRPGLDPIIEADTYKANGKFFEFLANKEVVRSLALDLVLQIRRIDDDEADDSEDDLAGPPVPASMNAVSPDQAGLDQLLEALTPDPAELDQLLDSITLDPAELNQLLDSMTPDPAALNELLDSTALDQAALDELLASARFDPSDFTES